MSGLKLFRNRLCRAVLGLFPVEQIAQAAEIGVPLAAELVDFAAMAYLVFQLPASSFQYRERVSSS